MSHMVIYRGSDGKPGYQQAEDIHDAVTFVEQMRNEDGVEHARIFRLEEVVFEYRPYFRVELSSLGTPLVDGPGVAQVTGPVTGPVAAVPAAASASTAPSPTVDLTDDATAVYDEALETVDGAMDVPDLAEMSEMSDAVAGNGSRRGLFGR